jgi:hypothetical protein
MGLTLAWADQVQKLCFMERSRISSSGRSIIPAPRKKIEPQRHKVYKDHKEEKEREENEEKKEDSFIKVIEASSPPVMPQKKMLL